MPKAPRESAAPFCVTWAGASRAPGSRARASLAPTLLGRTLAPLSVSDLGIEASRRGARVREVLRASRNSRPSKAGRLRPPVWSLGGCLPGLGAVAARVLFGGLGVQPPEGAPLRRPRWARCSGLPAHFLAHQMHLLEARAPAGRRRSYASNASPCPGRSRNCPGRPRSGLASGLPPIRSLQR